MHLRQNSKMPSNSWYQHFERFVSCISSWLLVCKSYLQNKGLFSIWWLLGQRTLPSQTTRHSNRAIYYYPAHSTDWPTWWFAQTLMVLCPRSVYSLQRQINNWPKAILLTNKSLCREVAVLAYRLKCALPQYYSSRLQLEERDHFEHGYM